MDVELLGKLLLPLALFLMMLGVGVTLEWRDLARVFRQGRVALVVGLFGQLVLLPGIGALVCLVLQLPPLVAAALMIVTLAPGGVTSNMITLVVRGDTALSVALTAVGSLITPFTLPLLTALVLSYTGISSELSGFPVLPSILKLATVTLLPVLIGVALRARFPDACQALYPWVKRVAIVGFLAMVAVIILANRERLPALLQSYAQVALLLSVLAMGAGACLGWLFGVSGPGRLTLAIEVGIQNAGTALMVTGTLLANPEMSAVVLIYGVVMQLPAAMLMLYRNLPARAQRSAVN